MGNVHLVTGYAGKSHVTAADHGSLLEALIRGGDFVMEAGANYAASIVTNNQIRVSDGELIMQGRHVKLDPGTYVDLTIDNGTQGYLRYDLIVMRYTRDAETGIEDANLVVIKGNPSETVAVDPEYTTGSINAEGAVLHDFPLYRVSLSGLTVEAVTALFEPQQSVLASCIRLIDECFLQLSASDVGAAPAIESTDYPGCYYRIVDGVTEWLNPPLVPGVEFCTTERYNGNKVYAKLFDAGVLPNASTKSVWPGLGDIASEVVSVVGIFGATAGSTKLNIMPYESSSSGNIVRIKSPGLSTTVIECTGDESANSAYILYKYTKK